MSELKPCPFCGGETIEIVDTFKVRRRYQASCCDCDAWGRGGDTVEVAEAHWNTRPDSLAITAAVQGEREAMRSKVHALRTEVDCRIDHGANHGGHLDYVRDALDRILKGIDVCSECDGERWHKYENPLTGEITNRTPCSTCNGDEEVAGPSTAVDVMAVVRRYVKARRAYDAAWLDFDAINDSDAHSVDPFAEELGVAGEALAALVDGKGEAKDGGAR